jgi:hypothetical protein
MSSKDFEIFKLPTKYSMYINEILIYVNITFHRSRSLADISDPILGCGDSSCSLARVVENSAIVPQFANYTVPLSQVDESITTAIVEDKLCGLNGVFVGTLSGISTCTIKWWWVARLLELMIIYVARIENLIVEVRLRKSTVNEKFEWVIYTDIEENAQIIRKMLNSYDNISILTVFISNF